ncbi:MAG: hypothetical protein ABW078_11975 [Sedimenticola sp.]
MGEQLQVKKSGSSIAGRNDTDRKLWVVAVLAFWVSLAITLAFFLVTGEVDLILLSITLGTMVLGIWLKARYQLKQRNPGGGNHDST